MPPPVLVPAPEGRGFSADPFKMLPAGFGKPRRNHRQAKGHPIARKEIHEPNKVGSRCSHIIGTEKNVPRIFGVQLFQGRQTNSGPSVRIDRAEGNAIASRPCAPSPPLRRCRISQQPFYRIFRTAQINIHNGSGSKGDAFLHDGAQAPWLQLLIGQNSQNPQSEPTARRAGPVPDSGEKAIPGQGPARLRYSCRCYIRPCSPTGLRRQGMTKSPG